MKRLLLTAVALIGLCVSVTSAQTRWGITGGMGFNQSKFTEIINDKNPVGWNAGLHTNLRSRLRVQKGYQCQQVSRL